MNFYLFSPEWFQSDLFPCVFVFWISWLILAPIDFAYHFELLLSKKWGSVRIDTLSITFTFHYTFQTLALRPNEFHPIHVQLYTAVKSNYADFDETESTWAKMLSKKIFRRLYTNSSLVLLSRNFVYSLNVTSMFIFTIHCVYSNA